MSRKLMRVPMDFDWPLHKTWSGYLTPEEFRFPQCDTCGGDGQTPEARAIAKTFYPHQIGHATDALAWNDKLGQAEVDNLIAEGRLRTLVPREPTEDNPRDWEWVALPRTAAEVNAAQRCRGGGDKHDAINRWILISFRCKVLGITEHCPTCEGNGDIATPEQREAADEDHTVEPPTGEGYQMWETTSEGSPVSPVFEDIEMLCQYAADFCTVFGKEKTTAAEWRRMLDADWVTHEMVAPDGTRMVFL